MPKVRQIRFLYTNTEFHHRDLGWCHHLQGMQNKIPTQTGHHQPASRRGDHDIIFRLHREKRILCEYNIQEYSGIRRTHPDIIHLLKGYQTVI